MILFGEGNLRRSIREFVALYHQERNHQGIGNELIEVEPPGQPGGEVRCRQRLGGLLSYSHRAA
jgi:hypothetical protein